jgi:hypothetical protein
MACFLVSAAEAAVVKVVETVEEKKEIKLGSDNTAHEDKIPLSRKLKWLNYLLIGGAVLLMFEHVWHGEVVPWFPFLTAMSDPEDTAEMLHEMATVGVTMALLVTAVWAGICVCADSIVKRSADDTETARS